MLKEPYKRGPTTPRVVYLCPLDLGGLIGVRRRLRMVRARPDPALRQALFFAPTPTRLVWVVPSFVFSVDHVQRRHRRQRIGGV